MRARLATIGLVIGLSLAGAGVGAQSEAERQLDAAIERLRTALGPDARIVIGSREVNPLTGRARLGDVRITEGGRDLSIAELLLRDISAERLGRAEARGLRLLEAPDEVTEVGLLLVAGLALPAPGAGFDPATLGFDAVELEAVSVEAPGRASFGIGRLQLRGHVPGGAASPGRLAYGMVENLEFESRLADAPTVSISRVTATGLAFPDPNAPVPDPLAFRAEGLEIQGLEVADTARDFEMSLQRFTLRDWVPGRRTELVVEGASVAAAFGQLGPGRLEIGRVNMAGIDAAATLAAVMGGLQPPDPAAGVPQLLAIENVELEANGAPLFALGRLAAEASIDSAGQMAGALLLEDFFAAIPRNAAPPLEQMGFREVAGSIELRGEGARAGGPLSIAPLAITWEGAGTLTLRADLENMPSVPAGARLDRDAEMAKYAQARLAGATLSYQDQGLLGRVLTQQARQQRIPEARLREQWAQMALGLPIPGAEPGGPDAAAFDPMRRALATFLRQPRAIEIALRPARPVTFADIPALGAAGPAEAARSLGLSLRLP